LKIALNPNINDVDILTLFYLLIIFGKNNILEQDLCVIIHINSYVRLFASSELICLLSHGVVCVFVSFCVLVFVRAILSGCP